MTDTQQKILCLQCQEELRISLLNQKQATVALSTAEEEYIALGSAAQEAIWLRQLQADLNIDIGSSIEILEEDNQIVIRLNNGYACRHIYQTITKSIILSTKI